MAAAGSGAHGPEASRAFGMVVKPIVQRRHPVCVRLLGDNKAAAPCPGILTGRGVGATHPGEGTLGERLDLLGIRTPRGAACFTRVGCRCRARDDGRTDGVEPRASSGKWKWRAVGCAGSSPGNRDATCHARVGTKARICG